MKERKSVNYIGTYPNTPDGIALYKRTIKVFRRFNSMGTFFKMFRGNKRGRTTLKHTPLKVYDSISNASVLIHDSSARTHGTSLKKGATHFDGYFTGFRDLWMKKQWEHDQKVKNGGY